MDLAELSRRTDFERRKLRYVLDHKLVPELQIEIVDDEVGRPRKFAEDIGFAVVCAAHLLDLRLPHETIRLYLRGLLEIKLGPTDSQPALAYVLAGSCAAHADLGDQQRVRLRLKLEDAGFDSGWVIPGHRSLGRGDFEPTSVISLNIGQIRDQVFVRKSQTS